MRRIDLAGEKFSRLTVVGCAGKRGRSVVWNCVCVCGGSATSNTDNLRRGKTRSCGCLIKETSAQINFHHGESKTLLYGVWLKLRNRCLEHPDYAGRGIKVCEEWADNYETFAAWSKGNGYRKGLSIDRIDNSRGYSPDNCRWTTAKVQARNTRRNVRHPYRGKMRSVAEIAEAEGVGYFRLHGMLKRGASVDEAVMLARKRATMTNSEIQRDRALRVECKQGHPLAGANLYEWRGERRCKKCAAATQALYASRRD